jgi:hypothetical protein
LAQKRTCILKRGFDVKTSLAVVFSTSSINTGGEKQVYLIWAGNTGSFVALFNVFFGLEKNSIMNTNHMTKMRKSTDV